MKLPKRYKTFLNKVNAIKKCYLFELKPNKLFQEHAQHWFKIWRIKI